MVNLPVWQRGLAIVALLAISMWLTAMGLQTIRVTCGSGTCVHEVRYAGIATRETTFETSSSNVSWRRTGKYNNLGVVDIQPSSGDRLHIKWLSAEEAEAAAHGITHDPTYRIDSTGPRWWLLFLFGTIPLALSFVIRPRIRIPDGAAPPVEQTKKAARASRGKSRKARERSKR